MAKKGDRKGWESRRTISGFRSIEQEKSRSTISGQYYSTAQGNANKYLGIPRTSHWTGKRRHGHFVRTLKGQSPTTPANGKEKNNITIGGKSWLPRRKSERLRKRERQVKKTPRMVSRLGFDPSTLALKGRFYLLFVVQYFPV